MISFRKVFAIMDAKTKTLMSKNFFLMMLFSIGYGILMNSVIPRSCRRNYLCSSISGRM